MARVWFKNGKPEGKDYCGDCAVLAAGWGGDEGDVCLWRLHECLVLWVITCRGGNMGERERQMGGKRTNYSTPPPPPPGSQRIRGIREGFFVKVGFQGELKVDEVVVVVAEAVGSRCCAGRAR